MTAAEPIDVGTDAYALTTKDIAIANNPRHVRSRPYNLTKDVEIWEIYVEAKAWRNSIANTTSISWVKGHANQKHIDEGFTWPYDKAGNDAADSAAEHNYTINEFCKAHRIIRLLADRKTAYTKM